MIRRGEDEGQVTAGGQPKGRTDTSGSGKCQVTAGGQPIGRTDTSGSREERTSVR